MAKRRVTSDNEDAPSASTVHLSTYQGPRLVENELRANPELFKLPAVTRLENESTRKGSAVWDWTVIERAYVEGWIGSDGEVHYPSLAELARVSGCSYQTIRNRSSSQEWDRKRRIVEENLPRLVEEKVAAHVADRIGDYLATADEALVRRSAREWVRLIAEPYLNRYALRLDGKLERFGMKAPAPNAGDAEKLLKLLLLIEGEATERVQVVGLIQTNLQIQAEATVDALQGAVGRGLIPENHFAEVLSLIEERVGSCKWRYREDKTG